MDCKTRVACKRELRINKIQRDNVLSRAFQLDIKSPRAAFPGAYPFRWEIREMPNLIVHHYADDEEHRYIFDTEEGQPGILVHIEVYVRQGSHMVFSVDLRKHEVAETLFRTELLRVHGQYTIYLDDLAQDKDLLRQGIDEAELPDAWKRSG